MEEASVCQLDEPLVIVNLAEPASLQTPSANLGAVKLSEVPGVHIMAQPLCF